MKTYKINKRYLPKILSRKDRKKQSKMLLKSKKLYKKGKYYTRKNISSYKSKPSTHITDAVKLYKVPVIDANKELSKASGCSISSLKQIIRKGEGAYFSSGSRPNQTAQSWGKARLASALTSGKASAVDYNILEKGCKPNSQALALAKKARLKYGFGKRKAVKTKIIL
jgi:hypothetical protein